MSLLTAIDRHLRRTGMAETTFGRQTINDPRLVADLRRGRQPGASVRARVEAAIGTAPGSSR